MGQEPQCLKSNSRCIAALLILVPLQGGQQVNIPLSATRSGSNLAARSNASLVRPFEHNRVTGGIGTQKTRIRLDPDAPEVEPDSRRVVPTFRLTSIIRLIGLYDLRVINIRAETPRRILIPREGLNSIVRVMVIPGDT